MANAYINIYKGSPTAGATDGTAVSLGNSYTEPIRFALDAEQNETQIEKCAIRTEAGYAAQDVVIRDLNDSADRFKLCKTANGTFTDEITFPAINATNSVFYVKATSINTEPPQTDRTVKLRFTGTLFKV